MELSGAYTRAARRISPRASTIARPARARSSVRSAVAAWVAAASVSEVRIARVGW